MNSGCGRKGILHGLRMELDYMRYPRTWTETSDEPCCHSGKAVCLNSRDGQWVLLSWHESFRTCAQCRCHGIVDERRCTAPWLHRGSTSSTPDLSGEWEILEVEDDKHYKATLDKAGNGPYTQHGGRFVTTKYADRLWQGTWHQPGNDREGRL